MYIQEPHVLNVNSQSMVAVYLQWVSGSTQTTSSATFVIIHWPKESLKNILVVPFAIHAFKKWASVTIEMPIQVQCHSILFILFFVHF